MHSGASRLLIRSEKLPAGVLEDPESVADVILGEISNVWTLSSGSNTAAPFVLDQLVYLKLVNVGAIDVLNRISHALHGLPSLRVLSIHSMADSCDLTGFKVSLVCTRSKLTL